MTSRDVVNVRIILSLTLNMVQFIFSAELMTVR